MQDTLITWEGGFGFEKPLLDRKLQQVYGDELRRLLDRVVHLEAVQGLMLAEAIKLRAERDQAVAERDSLRAEIARREEAWQRRHDAAKAAKRKR
ncbi:MAG TPA: hypothetical protein VEC14_02395 [Reyranellaceae bacterium]|nr:hypothetical protein [Reyranellaceae bacterium]